MDEQVKVVVREHNNYGGARAGTQLVMLRSEYEANQRCLVLASDEFEVKPRTQVVSLRAEEARRLGLPLGRRQEGPICYEVTRLPPDGKPRIPSRQELEARGSGREAHVRLLVDSKEIQAEIQKVRDEAMRDAAEYVNRRIDEMRAELAAKDAEIAKLRETEQKPAAKGKARD